MDANGFRKDRIDRDSGDGFHRHPGSDRGATSLLESRRRILLVADEAFRADDLLTELSHRGFRGSPRSLSVLVITPSLPGSALGQAANDIDGAVLDAYSRLEMVLDELHRAGVPAAGMVGDDDPVVALGDGLRLFEADDVVVIGHVDDDAGWAERHLLERLETNFEEEFSALLVERPVETGVAPETVETRSSRELTGVTPTGSRSRREALAGIVFGLAGTVGLGFLVVGAADSVAPATGDIAGPVAALILITIVAFLLNIAAAVALIFTLGLDYRGVWQRVIARSAIALTASCLIASALIWAMFL